MMSHPGVLCNVSGSENGWSTVMSKSGHGFRSLVTSHPESGDVGQQLLQLGIGSDVMLKVGVISGQ